MKQESRGEPFAIMAKPVGSKCNLNCEYCYYLGTDELIGNKPAPRMDDSTLETLIRRYIEESSGRVVHFTWHGGEPTLAGLDFFKRAVELQKKYLPAGYECWNNLQTNGILLDDEWCEFLAAERFDVGLSIDGAGWIHDRYRRDAAGVGTYERVSAAVRRLVDRGVRPDLLCTVTSDSSAEPLEVYRALRNLNTGWVQFIPIVRCDESGKVTEDSVTPEGYGEFLCAVFDEWIYNDVGKMDVQLFAETGRVLAGGGPGLCWMAPVCGRVLVVERDGGVYSCDHFVRPAYRLGNVLTDGLRELLESPEQRNFGEVKRSTLTAQCRACKFLPMCGGGCPKDRFSVSDSGENRQYYLCAGLLKFFNYAESRLSELVSLRREGKSPEAVMALLREEESRRWEGVGRNDPCPCGSGKKAKNCCWGRRP
ncbi:MAG: anaerobic sulfatase maturase [Oscillospiraceae bacterium]